VVHRDLKGGNILAASDGTVKLADFGACKYISGLPLVADNSEMCNSMRGSLYWMAPEILREEGYGRKVDIWSLGCTIVEMATASHPWRGIRTYSQLIMEIINGSIPEIPATLSNDARDFV
jgi:serine/threonine protein kinase